MTFRAVTTALGLLLVASAAQAHHGACRADVEQFCKDVKPGEGRIIDCLKQHENELSEQCKAAGEKMRSRANEFKAACQPDLDQFCKDVPPGHGRIRECLHENKDKLSATCADFTAKHHERQERHQQEQQ
jgi:hypothetical protein